MYCVTPFPPSMRTDPILNLDDADSLIAANRDVLIDLKFIEYLGGSSFGVVAYLTKRLAMRERRLFVCNVTGQPSDILIATGLLPRLIADRSNASSEYEFTKPDRERSVA